MDGTPLQLALREMQQAYRSPRMLLGMAALSIVLGYAGPFDTFRLLPVLPRVAYWAILVFATYGVGLVGGLSLLNALERWRRHIVWRVLLIGVGASLPVTVVVALVNLGFLGGNPFEIHSLAVLWSYCFAVSVAVGVMYKPPPQTIQPDRSVSDAPSPETPPPAILNRVPIPRRGHLLALSVKDHYVEVLTDRGRSLVLMRLSDAIAETGTVAGLRIHRSHWVALGAVQRVVRTGGKTLIELPGGEQLPVSRGYLPAAKAAGVLV